MMQTFYVFTVLQLDTKISMISHYELQNCIGKRPNIRYNNSFIRWISITTCTDWVKKKNPDDFLFHEKKFLKKCSYSDEFVQFSIKDSTTIILRESEWERDREREREKGRVDLLTFNITYDNAVTMILCYLNR